MFKQLVCDEQGALNVSNNLRREHGFIPYLHLSPRQFCHPLSVFTAGGEYL